MSFCKKKKEFPLFLGSFSGNCILLLGSLLNMSYSYPCILSYSASWLSATCRRYTSLYSSPSAATDSGNLSRDGGGIYFDFRLPRSGRISQLTSPCFWRWTVSRRMATPNFMDWQEPHTVYHRRVICFCMPSASMQLGTTFMALI